MNLSSSRIIFSYLWSEIINFIRNKIMISSMFAFEIRN
jgi:hypothetical protein